MTPNSREMTKAHGITASAHQALQIATDLVFSEGGMTLFFILPAVIALFLLEALPQF